MNCALCFAISETREGNIPDGGGIPLCAEHRARTYWQSRRPPAPVVVTWPPTVNDLLIQAAVPLADLAVPKTVD